MHRTSWWVTQSCQCLWNMQRLHARRSRLSTSLESRILQSWSIRDDISQHSCHHQTTFERKIGYENNFDARWQNWKCLCSIPDWIRLTKNFSNKRINYMACWRQGEMFTTTEVICHFYYFWKRNGDRNLGQKYPFLR